MLRPRWGRGGRSVLSSGLATEGGAVDHARPFKIECRPVYMTARSSDNSTVVESVGDSSDESLDGSMMPSAEV